MASAGPKWYQSSMYRDNPVKLPMRIALIVPGGVDRSGEHRVIPVLLALISRLSRHSDVQVLALNQEKGPGEWDLAGARVHNIGSGRTLFRAFGKICSLHRSAPFDLVHAIWSGHAGLVAVTAARMLGRPSIVHVAGGELVSIPEIAYGGRRAWHGRLRERFTLGAASVVTSASQPTIDVLSEIGLDAQRVPLGVDLQEWPAREPARRDPGRPARLIHVASLNRVKDQATLLRALASLQQSGLNFELDLVGEDTLNGEIQRTASQLGLAQKIRFRGFLTQRQLRPVVEAADLMIVSSRHETGPVALLEAAVAGVPTVGTAVGHISEWAPCAAASVPVGDWSRLAGAIARVLGDEELRLRIARQAQVLAVRESADYTLECFQQIYGRLRGVRAR
jgi:glycosyltransferase involved in cell wall biosynthesis